MHLFYEGKMHYYIKINANVCLLKEKGNNLKKTNKTITIFVADTIFRHVLVRKFY